MNYFVLLLLALVLRVFGSNYGDQNSVAVYSITDFEKCPKIKQPLCATNGREFLYFENKCQLEAKNYEVLTLGLMEFCECPLRFCTSNCPTCYPVHKGPTTNACPEYCSSEYRPICARFLTLEKEFSNECELKTTICQTKQKWDIVKQGPCHTSNYDTVTDLHSIDDRCPIACTEDYKPICAKFHNTLRVFRNPCELQKNICLGQDYEIIKEGLCLENQSDLQHIKCPGICSNNYRPLCAQYNGEYKEFGNSCKLIKALCQTNKKWQVKPFDSCLKNTAHVLSSAGSCLRICTKEFEPICARFGDEIRFFNNRCILDIWNCATETKWEILHFGVCTTDSFNLLAANTTCPQYCSTEYRPVCAAFKSKLREFYNNCELQKTICETNTNWEVIKAGHCPSFMEPKHECQNICTRELIPVCGSFNGKLKLFNNICEFQKASCNTNIAWKLVALDRCSSHLNNTLLDAISCPKVCSTEYKPICGQFEREFRSFKNKCEMRKTSCETKTNWQLVESGHCPSLNTESQNSCPRLCSKEYNPVCSRFNGELREFSNICELQKSACETYAEWELIHNSLCDFNLKSKSIKILVKSPCENAVLDPICAICDNTPKTFNHLCQLAEEIKRQRSNCSILYSGICSNTNLVNMTTTSSVNISQPKSVTLEIATQSRAASGNTKSEHRIRSEVSNTRTLETSKQAAKAFKTTKPKTNKNNLKTINRDFSDYISKTPLIVDKQITKEVSEEIDDISNDYDVQIDDLEEGSSISGVNSDRLHSDQSKSSESETVYEVNNSTNNSKKYSKEVKSNVGSHLKENSMESREVTAGARTFEKNVSEGVRESKKINKSKYNTNGLGNQMQEHHSKNSQDSGAPPFIASNYFKDKFLTKWLKKQIQEMLVRATNSRSSEESVSDETDFSSQTAKKFNGNSKSFRYENQDTSNAEHQQSFTANQQMVNNFNVTSRNETNDKEDQHNNANIEYTSYPVSQNTQILNLYEKKEVGGNEKLTALDIGIGQSQLSSNNNSSKAKKPEIYNGVVYKAPVYDAPTYNIIYTAPFNYHAQSYGKPIIAGQQNEIKPEAVVTNNFDNFKVSSSLAALNDGFVNVANESNALNANQALLTMNNHIKWPTNSSYDKLPLQFPLIHPVIPLSAHNAGDILPSVNGHFAANIPNLIQLKQNENNNYHRQSNQPVYKPYKGHNVLSSSSKQSAALPQEFTAPSAPVSLISSNSSDTSLNSTLMQKIVATLKALTNGY